MGHNATINSNRQATGVAPANVVSAGVYSGSHATVAVATTVLCAWGPASMSMVEFTYVGASSPYARTVAKPPNGEFQFQTDNATRMELNGNGATVPQDVNATRALCMHPICKRS